MAAIMLPLPIMRQWPPTSCLRLIFAVALKFHGGGAIDHIPDLTESCQLRAANGRLSVLGIGWRSWPDSGPA